MNEENKDSNPPRLRLSSSPQKPEEASETGANPEKAASAKETSAPKPNLRLKRPEATPEGQANGSGATASARADSEVKSPSESEAEANLAAAANPAAGQKKPTFSPESPVRNTTENNSPNKESQLSPKIVDRLPTDVPARIQEQEEEQQEEDATDTSEEVSKRKGLLISIIVILLLLGILGGSGYGLYYLLMSSEKTPDAPTPTPAANIVKASKQEPEASSEQTTSKSTLSQPIAKAKAVVTKIQDQDPEAAWKESEEVSAPAPPLSEAHPEVELPPSESTTHPQPPEDLKPAPAAPTPQVHSNLTNAVSAFLQKAHIGGVRTGERPKLILNGSSYDQGDLIDSKTGLRFIGLRDKKIAFQDAQGTVYVKSF